MFPTSENKVFPIFGMACPPQKTDRENDPPAKLPQRHLQPIDSDEADTACSSDDESDISDIDVPQHSTHSSQHSLTYTHQQHSFNQIGQYSQPVAYNIQTNFHQNQYSQQQSAVPSNQCVSYSQPSQHHHHHQQQQQQQQTTKTITKNSKKSKPSEAPDMRSRLITLIREHSCIWNVSSPSKKDRGKIDKHWAFNPSGE